MRVTPAALESQREYAIPACVTIAQAILESATPQFGWGSSTLFRLANNPFGIKYCHFPSGDLAIGSSGNRTIRPSEMRGNDELTNRSPDHPLPEDYGHFDATTWEIENGQKRVVTAQFQRFPDLKAAFRCHALLLAKSPRYAPAMQVIRDSGSADQGAENDSPHAGNAARGTESTENREARIPSWQKFAERLGPKTSQLDSEHCGYSTNPSYSAELIKLVNLYRLNDPRALAWYATGQDPGRAGPRDSGLGLKPAGGLGARQSPPGDGQLRFAGGAGGSEKESQDSVILKPGQAEGKTLGGKS
jgi:flagellum-specific peptidoglycan hydrolase FlgJ